MMSRGRGRRSGRRRNSILGRSKKWELWGQRSPNQMSSIVITLCPAACSLPSVNITPLNRTSTQGFLQHASLHVRQEGPRLVLLDENCSCALFFWFSIDLGGHIGCKLNNHGTCLRGKREKEKGVIDK